MTVATRTGCSRFAEVICISILFAGCAEDPPAAVTRVGERVVEFSMQGKGLPVVVFESGLGDDLAPWDIVAASTADRTTSFSYSRAGYGQSAASKSPRRDPQTVAAELDELLRSMKLPPPYVLVGHSIGGLYVQAYAAAFPQKIAGMVLVDPTHPDQIARARREAPGDARLVDVLSRLFGDPARAEFQAYAEATTFNWPAYAGPVVVLAAKQKQMTSSTAFHELRGTLLRDIARHYPQAQLRWIDSSHYIQLEQPQAVVAAVESVLDSLGTPRVAALP